jgi:hypothetical protein|tara:strand:- start:142 stop:288 length:147 start_codon:yes stop_codon:yes gene_type:complete
MAIYICGYCDGMKDDDYNPPEELANYDLVCEDCNVNYFNEKGEENESD